MNSLQSATANRNLRLMGQYLLLMVLVLSINFALPRLAPGSPFNQILGENDAVLLDDAQRARVLQGFGLERPLGEQFSTYLQDISQGQLGDSIGMGLPVADILADRLGWTLLLMLPGWLLSGVFGVLLGVFCAWHHGRWPDRAGVALLTLCSSLPPFWIAMLLVSFFAVQLGWLPSFGAYPITAIPASVEWYIGIAERLILPVLSLAIVHSGSVFLTTRNAMLLVLKQDYILFAKARGFSRSQLFFGPALRNAMLPISTQLIQGLGGALGGALVIETVFAWPGIGSLIVDAVHARDYPLLQGIFLVTSVGIIIANLLAELSYPLLDPRLNPRLRHPS